MSITVLRKDDCFQNRSRQFQNEGKIQYFKVVENLFNQQISETDLNLKDI